MAEDLLDAVRAYTRTEPGELARDAVLPRLQEIQAARRLLDAAEAGLLARIDDDVIYADTHARDTKHLLTQQAGVSPGDAARRVLAARTVEQLPVTAAALAAGELSADQVAVLGRVCNPGTYEALLADEAVMVGWAKTLPFKEFARKVRNWEADHDPQLAGVEHRPSTVTLSLGVKGRGVLAGDLDPADYLALSAAMHEETERIFRQEVKDRETGIDVGERPQSERAAEALINILQRALNGPDDKMYGVSRAQIGIMLTEAELKAGKAGRSVEDDEPISAEVIEHLSCDAEHYRAVLDARGEVLDLGRTVRTATPAQRRAVVARDRRCITPGCDRPPRMCQVHHVHYFSNGGTTTVSRLVLLCPRHHRQLHSGKWRIIENPKDRPERFRFENQHGRQIIERDRKPQAA